MCRSCLTDFHSLSLISISSSRISIWCGDLAMAMPMAMAISTRFPKKGMFVPVSKNCINNAVTFPSPQIPQKLCFCCILFGLDLGSFYSTWTCFRHFDVASDFRRVGVEHKQTIRHHSTHKQMQILWIS